MNVSQTGFKDLLVIEPKIFGDERGFFMESYNRETFIKAGININFVQDNQSRSSQGVLRGLHFQRAPHAQTKLVRVLAGKVLDVVVDLRRSEPTFGKHFALELSSENKLQLLVPKGFAHGFLVLSDTADVFYKCDEFYNPQADGGVLYSSCGVDWKMSPGKFIISHKDQNLPDLQNAKFEF